MTIGPTIGAEFTAPGVAVAIETKSDSPVLLMYRPNDTSGAEVAVVSAVS